MYRPKDWENPYTRQEGTKQEFQCKLAFEAGADAILERLMAHNQLDHIEVRGKKCKVVFIPEEDERR